MGFTYMTAENGLFQKDLWITSFGKYHWKIADMQIASIHFFFLIFKIFNPEFRRNAIQAFRIISCTDFLAFSVFSLGEVWGLEEEDV